MYKITPVIILLLSTGFVHANDNPTQRRVSIDDALQLCHEQNHNIRNTQAQLLLLDQKQQMVDNKHLPSVQPVDIYMDPQNKEVNINTGVKWNLSNGGELNAKYTHKVNTEEDDKYRLSYHHPLTHNTTNIDDQLQRIDTTIQKLQQQLNYQNTMQKLKVLYQQCVIDQQLYEHAKNMHIDMQSMLKQQQIELQYGQISQLDYDKTKISLAQKSIDLAKQEQSLELNMMQLKRQLGINIHYPIAIDSDIHFSQKNITPQQAIDSALQHNVSLKIAQLTATKSSLSNDKQKSVYLPHIALHASINQDQTVNTGISFRYSPPSDEDEYNHAQKLLTYTQAQEQYQEYELDLRMQLHQTLITLQHLESVIDLSQESLNNQQAQYQAASIQFKHQQISAQDFQKASNELQKAYHDTLMAQKQYSEHTDKLLAYMGQLHPLSQPDGTIL